MAPLPPSEGVALPQISSDHPHVRFDGGIGVGPEHRAGVAPFEPKMGFALRAEAAPAFTPDLVSAFGGGPHVEENYETYDHYCDEGEHWQLLSCQGVNICTVPRSSEDRKTHLQSSGKNPRFMPFLYWVS